MNAFPRVEAPAKITGAARYAADHHPSGVLHAVLVGAPVAAGRLRGVDAHAAFGATGGGRRSHRVGSARLSRAVAAVRDNPNAVHRQ